MKLILLPLLLLASAFISAQQLDTPNYTVEIQQLCPEGEVQCQQVLYKGTSKVSGASIELKLEDNWRRIGQVINAVNINQQLWLLALLPNDITPADSLRLAGEQPLLLSQHALPYSLN